MTRGIGCPVRSSSPWGTRPPGPHTRRQWQSSPRVRKVTSGKCPIPLRTPNRPPQETPLTLHSIHVWQHSWATSSNELGLLEPPLEAGQVSWWQPQTRWLQTTGSPPPPPQAVPKRRLQPLLLQDSTHNSTPPSGPAGLTSPGAALRKTVWRLLEKLKIQSPDGPDIPLPGICPKEVKAGRQGDVWTPTFAAALSTTAKMWKQPKCLPTEE